MQGCGSKNEFVSLTFPPVYALSWKDAEVAKGKMSLEVDAKDYDTFRRWSMFRTRKMRV
jgi:hypothetical protein